MQYVPWHRADKGKGMIPDNVSRSQLDSLIEEWVIGKNAERDRAILRRRLFDGLTYEIIADEFQMSVRQIKTIVYKWERIIFSKL